MAGSRKWHLQVQVFPEDKTTKHTDTRTYHYLYNIRCTSSFPRVSVDCGANCWPLKQFVHLAPSSLNVQTVYNTHLTSSSKVSFLSVLTLFFLFFCRNPVFSLHPPSVLCASAAHQSSMSKPRNLTIRFLQEEAEAGVMAAKKLDS